MKMKSKQKTRLVVVESGEICYKSDKDAEVPTRMLSGSIHLPQGENNCFGGGQRSALKSPLNNINPIKTWSAVSPGESGFRLHTQAVEGGRHRSLQERKHEVDGAISTRPGAPPVPSCRGEQGETRRSSYPCKRPPRRQFYDRPSYVSAGELRSGPGSARWSPTVLPRHRFLAAACKPPEKSIFLKPPFTDPATTSSGPTEQFTTP